jgi:DNA-binding transcriptional MerR regulator
LFKINVNVNVNTTEEPVPAETTWTISELAAEFEISTRTIRFYEEKGLISPGRTPGGHRVYNKRNRARLKLILRGKRFGYSLEEISEMIGLAAVDMDEKEQIRKTLDYADKRLLEVSDKIGELKIFQQDILEMKKRLIRRLTQLASKGQARPG